MALIDDALRLAADGLPVFPCNAQKQPVIAGGFKAASTDPAEIRRMFATPGAALIGVPAGIVTRCVVIDVDPRHNGHAWYDDHRDALPPTRTHRTMSGGMHLLFAHPLGDLRIGNRSGVFPGVDVRGDGGYIIAPPSPGYEIVDDSPLAELPQWLLNAILRRERDERRPPPDLGVIPDAYVRAAVDAETRAVSNAIEGHRNDTLNRAAFALGQLVGAHALGRREAEARLLAAALTCGLDHREADATIRSGLDGGEQHPRRIEPRKPAERPHAPAARDVADYPPEAHPAPPEAEDEAAESIPARVLPLVWFADVAVNLDALDFVEGLLTDAAMSVVYGESNSGKTFFATDLALHIAAGKPWRDRDVTQGAVIYCALEGGHGIRNRVAAWRQHHGMDDARLPFAIVPVQLNMLDPDADTEHVIATVKYAAQRMELPARLVVFDTLSRALAGGNENGPDDMGALVMNGDRVRQETGAHTLWVHHSGKDQARGARGHSLLRAATDTEIEITDNGGVRSASVVKQRDMEGGQDFPFRLSPVELGTNARGKTISSCVAIPADDTPATPRAKRLSVDEQIALRILIRALTDAGEPDFPGVPSGLPSIPEAWWRERFYDQGKPGATPEAKQKSFRRAADGLLKINAVGMNRGRVWAI